MKKQDREAMSDEEMATDREENEGGLGQPLRSVEDCPLIGVTHKVTRQVQTQF